jgi:hypothetical protein
MVNMLEAGTHLCRLVEAIDTGAETEAVIAFDVAKHGTTHLPAVGSAAAAAGHRPGRVHSARFDRRRQPPQIGAAAASRIRCGLIARARPTTPCSWL